MEKTEYPEKLVISKEIYHALHPIERMMALALQKVGKVKILYENPKFKDLLNQNSLFYYEFL